MLVNNLTQHVVQQSHELQLIIASSEIIFISLSRPLSILYFNHLIIIHLLITLTVNVTSTRLDNRLGSADASVLAS